MRKKNNAAGDVSTTDTIPQIFQFDTQPVRTIERSGEVWFAAIDVCTALDLANPSQVVARLDEDERDDLYTVDGIGRRQSILVINEAGLYSLVLTSRKEEAKRFKRWITHEVLPTIRKTGSYGQRQSIPRLATLSRTSLTLIKALKEETNPAARRIIHQQLALSCRLLGIETPALEAIGADAPPVPPAVDEFWEVYEYLATSEEPVKLNHSRDPRQIALNLPQFDHAARERMLRIPPMPEIRRVLKDSRNPKFVASNKPINSAITGATVKCWVFAVVEEGGAA